MVHTTPPGSNLRVTVPPRSLATARSSSLVPKPVLPGDVTTGPDCSRQTSVMVSRLIFQLSSTEPLSLDKAPYLAALVASSCSASCSTSRADKFVRHAEGAWLRPGVFSVYAANRSSRIRFVTGEAALLPVITPALTELGRRSSRDSRLPKPVRSGSGRRSYNFSQYYMLRAAVVTRKLPW